MITTKPMGLRTRSTPRSAFVLLCSALLAGCAALGTAPPSDPVAKPTPVEPAKPKSPNLDSRYVSPLVKLGDKQHDALAPAFPYRQLTMKDFGAAKPAGYFSSFVNHLGATSCIELRTTKDSRLVARAYRVEGNIVYRASIDRLRLEAVFVPSCSWWNHSLPPTDLAYVLEHEQIHFGLSEVVALEMNQEILAVRKYLWAEGDSAKAALATLSKQTRSFYNNAVERLRAVHEAFDSETSGVVAKERQSSWLRHVQVRLNALRRKPTTV
ncbi:MAG: hypothetical protein AAF493_02720 [Pseudomonadota bacterium]